MLAALRGPWTDARPRSPAARAGRGRARRGSAGTATRRRRWSAACSTCCRSTPATSATSTSYASCSTAHRRVIVTCGPGVIARLGSDRRAPGRVGYDGGDCVPASRRPSDRVLTVPNVLSALRLLGVPVFLWLVLTEPDGCGRAAARGQRGHRLPRRQASPGAGTRSRRLGPAARPGRRPAVHPRHAHRPRRSATSCRWWLIAAARRPRRAARADPAGAAPARLRPAARALPRARRRRSTCCTRSRCCCSASGTATLGEVAHAFGWAFAIWGTALYWWAGSSTSCRSAQARDAAPPDASRGGRRPA